MPEAQTSRCPTCRADLYLVRGSATVRCLSCGSHSAITYDEDGRIEITHLPEGRPQRKQAQTSPRLVVGLLTAIFALLCAGSLNFRLFAPGVTPPKDIARPSGNATADGSNNRPDAPPSPDGLKVDKDLPPLILPDAGGMLVIRVNEEQPEAAEGPAVLVALDPVTQEKLWEIPELSLDTAPGWVGTPEHVVSLGEGGTIVIINAKNGETQELEKAEGRPQEFCNGDQPDEVFLEVRGGPSQRINTEDGSSAPSENPHPCSDRPEPPRACQESSQAMPRTSTCASANHAPKHEEIEGKFTLKDGEENVLIGTDPETRTRIVLMGFEEDGETATWVSPIPLEGEGPMEQSSTELADGVLYVTARNEGEPWNLVAMNSENGEAMWTTPLDATEESSMDRGINVVDGTVYLLDDETLHRINAATGELLAHIQPSPEAPE